MMMSKTSLVVHDQILRSIILVRDVKVILDADLATLYRVSTKVLVQAVKRNSTRFPDDFMFQLSAGEFANLKSQNVTSSSWGGRRSTPYAFTEQAWQCCPASCGARAQAMTLLRSPFVLTIRHA